MCIRDRSITDACADTDVALLGGRTTEHPGIIDGQGFDLAATALGIVDLGDEIDNGRIEIGDVIIGVHSTNLRTAGFSLVRAPVSYTHLRAHETVLDLV